MKNYLRAVTFRPATIFLAIVMVMPVFLSAQKKGKSFTAGKSYGVASYRNINTGDYLKNWLIAGPVKMNRKDSTEPSEAEQQRFFDQEIFAVASFTPEAAIPSAPVNDKQPAWKMYSFHSNYIDLDSIFSKPDFAEAYALAEIQADSSYVAFLSAGSDDGIKIWHNGKLVHKNWVARGFTPDQDLVPVSLQKGRNILLVKVYDINRDWGFSARFLNKAEISNRLILASGKGDLDEINLLLKAGADINKQNTSGLTSLQLAELNGREEVINLLLSKGAKKTPFPAATGLISALYKPVNDKPLPGIAVLVMQDGKAVYSKGFGFADIENRAEVTPQTKFRIGSITKQFTASAILKLQEAGKLNVNDKLTKYFPGFPGGDDVTLRHLLTHTSGIHSYTGKPDFITRVTSPVSSDSLISYFMNDAYDFKPGEEFRYNNSGYVLLGKIIEKVSGRSYDEFLKEQFFEPLGMANTGVYTASLKLENEAKGYSKPATDIQRAANWDMSWAGGAGALYSTVEDLAKWNEAVFHGKVLKEESMKAAWTPLQLNNGKTPPGGEYGYGWFISKYRGRKVIQHSGGLDGFISQLAYFPDDNLTVIMLTNVTPPQVNVNPYTIAEYYLWDKLDKQPSFSTKNVVVQDLKIYEGRYQFPNAAVMMITSDGKDLFAQLTGQQKIQIYPASTDEFIWKVVDARIKFNRNEKGEVISGHFSQGSAEIDAPKLKEETIITLDPSVYQRYLGKYDFGNSLQLAITSEEGKIYVQATNQPKFEMFPVSEREFILKEVNARVIFPEEAGGKTTRLVVDMAGQKKECMKIE